MSSPFGSVDIIDIRAVMVASLGSGVGAAEGIGSQHENASGPKEDRVGRR